MKWRAKSLATEARLPKAIPANTAGSDRDWCHCPACDHMWPQRRGANQRSERQTGEPAADEGRP